MESVGGYLNAFTGKETTCYYARALDAHVGRAIDTTCDLVLQPLFPPKEVVKEKEVIMEEMRMYEDSPEEVVFDRFERLVYNNHALGRPVIGYPQTVRMLSREDLCTYMGQYYTPNRMVLTVTGNVYHRQVGRYAEKAFRVLERLPGNGQREKVDTYQSGEVIEERPIQQAHMVLGRRGMDVHDSMRTSMTVLNTILGGGMSSRLNQNIREKYGYCYNVYSFLNMYSDTGDLGVYVGTDAGRIARTKKLVFRELDRLMQHPVSRRALQQVKNQIKGHIMLGLENMSNRMMRIARQELLFGRYITLDEVLEKIDQVTAEDVQAMAQAWFDQDQFSCVTLLPQSSQNHT